MSEPVIPAAHVRGAVDLASIAAAAAARTAPAASEGGAVDIVDVTELNFQIFAERSLTQPAFLLLCSRLAPQCAELRARVERIAAEFAGRMVLGVVDVDAEPGIAQAFQVQAVPAMVALIGGRPAPLFQGSPEDDQLRSVFEQVLQVAAEAGIGQGTAVGEDGEPEPAPLPPLHQEAYDAIEKGDYSAAIAAYDRALKENPKDADARAGRAQVGLLQRTAEADPAAIRAAAAANPTDVDAQLAAADLDVAMGAVEDAFARLLDALRVSVEDERERVRVRLIELFDVVGVADPRVIAARKDVASILN